ncbi:hypothetical protein [Ornithinimicrobium murale]|uniref:hypothetical protein n=1 Tax=Ornithinimicrobium murale TaxID=1050153 RepID=UPI000E0CCE48|nr:hypothetical protein [Ornithinimicrobium murale]
MIYGLTSLSGSPGVTTTAVAWATTATTPTLLLEADMTGGSAILAGRYRSEVPHEHTILAMATRDADMTVLEVLQAQSVPLPGAAADSALIPTIAEHQQATVLQTTWLDTAEALAELSRDGGVDVVIDLGRVTTDGLPWGLVSQLDALIVMAWTTLPALITLANGIPRLQDQVHGPHLGVLFVDADIGSYPEDVASQVSPAPSLGALPYSTKAAAVYSQGYKMARANTLRTYHRAIDRARATIAQQATRHRNELLGEGSTM